MKFRAHDTFFIRKGWLSKGMKNVYANPEVFVDKNNNPMDVLGIGANMVKALRYWLQAYNLTREPDTGKRRQTFTDFGTVIYENDRFIEEIGTLLLLHYQLSQNIDEATAWYFFFNEFNMLEFSKEDFVTALQSYIKMEEEQHDVAIRSLSDDFSCIINTYVPRNYGGIEKISPENNIDSPFGELGLIDIISREKKTYKKSSPSPNIFPSWVILAVIYDQAQGRDEIALNELLTAHKNIGRIFNLDAVSMLDVLHRAELTGELKIIRTSGLDVIHLQNQRTFIDCVKNYYGSLEEQI